MVKEEINGIGDQLCSFSVIFRKLNMKTMYTCKVSFILKKKWRDLKQMWRYFIRIIAVMGTFLLVFIIFCAFLCTSYMLKAIYLCLLLYLYIRCMPMKNSNC